MVAQEAVVGTRTSSGSPTPVPPEGEREGGRTVSAMMIHGSFPALSVG